MDFISMEKLLNNISESVQSVTDDMQLIIDLIHQQPKIDKITLEICDKTSDVTFYMK